jgi:uncharacterized protein
MKKLMNIEVCYALPGEQVILAVQLGEGSLVADAIEHSKILQTFPQIDLAKNRVGIFGKLVKLDTVLREKDRVEIYRGLIVDPKEARRKRADRKHQID